MCLLAKVNGGWPFNDGRCCTNPHWPARCPPTGFSPADAIRHWSAEGGHPIEDFAAEDHLTPVRLEFPILSLNPGLEATLRGAWRLASSNEVRSHASLKGHTPLTFAGGHMVARAELNNVR